MKPAGLMWERLPPAFVGRLSMKLASRSLYTEPNFLLQQVFLITQKSF